MTKTLIKTETVKEDEIEKVFLLRFSDGTEKMVSKYNTLRPSGTSATGLSVESIRKAGYHVTVYHYRTFIDMMHTEQLVQLPKSYIKNDHFALLPEGGYTHVCIYKDDEKLLDLFSVCSMSDNFCYKDGVRTCLNRIRSNVADKILDGTFGDD